MRQQHVRLVPAPPGEVRRRQRAAPALTEQQIHRAIVQHLHRRGVPGLLFLHPANGGYRRPAEAAILSGMGVRPGAPDLLLWHGGQSFAIELKAAGGRPSATQLALLADMKAAGVHVAVAVGLDAALQVLEGWGLLRGRVA